MATILYKPHCAKCGALIEGNITYKGVIERVHDSELYRESLIMINPDKCKCCGEVFTDFEIPLPRELNPEEMFT